ncbi:hypothetical protein HJG60_009272 [Phyllostomus discolor]|uniref:Uncharacterized protein n=1 Tax=Phyllostomus discolor TaxID=89673 RepID=A0A833YPT8_9CHIR|nr:hypothetical protein HJG60_009272 [Phyllostomus discolor]
MSQPENDEPICLSGALPGLSCSDAVRGRCKSLLWSQSSRGSEQQEAIFFKSLCLRCRCRCCRCCRCLAGLWGSWESSPQPAQAASWGPSQTSDCRGVGAPGGALSVLNKRTWGCRRSICHCS